MAAFFCIFRALELTSAARLVLLFYNTPFFAVIGAPPDTALWGDVRMVERV